MLKRHRPAFTLAATIFCLTGITTIGARAKAGGTGATAPFSYAPTHGNPNSIIMYGGVGAETDVTMFDFSCDDDEDHTGRIHGLRPLRPSGGLLALDIPSVSAYAGCFTSLNTAEASAAGSYTLEAQAATDLIRIEGCLNGSLDLHATDAGPQCDPGSPDWLTSDASALLGNMAEQTAVIIPFQLNSEQLVRGSLTLLEEAFPQVENSLLEVRLLLVGTGGHVAARARLVDGSGHPDAEFAKLMPPGNYILSLSASFNYQDSVHASCSNMNEEINATILASFGGYLWTD